jgi:hypothetical protein
MAVKPRTTRPINRLRTVVIVLSPLPQTREGTVPAARTGGIPIGAVVVARATTGGIAARLSRNDAELNLVINQPHCNDD